MKNIIGLIQIAVSALLMVCILMQARGSGLGSAFGGSGGSFRSKRGVEKMLFRVTVFLSVLFFITSIISATI